MTTDDHAETLSSEALRASSQDVIVSASGEIDLATAPTMFDAVASALAAFGDDGRLVFDLGAVTFMDSAGLKAIALACRNIPGRVAVRNAPAQVRRLLDISGIGQLVDVDG